MAYDSRARRHTRQAVRRAWLYSLLLTLPALLFLGIFFYQRQLDLVPALLIGLCLLIYLAFVASGLVDSFVRPLQTLSNVVASLREGDYSFRARGATSGDALGELAGEINALADLLQKQRVRSLEATALLARVLEVMHAPLFAFDRENRLQLVNNAGLKPAAAPTGASGSSTDRDPGKRRQTPASEPQGAKRETRVYKGATYVKEVDGKWHLEK